MWALINSCSLTGVLSHLTALLPVILTMNEQLHHLILGQDITLHLMFHTKCPPLKKKSIALLRLSCLCSTCSKDKGLLYPQCGKFHMLLLVWIVVIIAMTTRWGQSQYSSVPNHFCWWSMIFFLTRLHASVFCLPLISRSIHMTSVNRIFCIIHGLRRFFFNIGYMWFPVFLQKADDPAAIDQLMSSLDKNNDGELNFLEFWQLIGQLASKHGRFSQ